MREKMPNRRANTNDTLDYKGVSLEISFGHHEETGKIREIFVVTRKMGTEVDMMAKDTAVLISFLLQYGCPMQEVVDVLSSDTYGKPEGLAGMLALKVIEEDNRILTPREEGNG